MTLSMIESNVTTAADGFIKIESKRLAVHGLSVPDYKQIYGLQIYGLNETTPLETPTITVALVACSSEGWRPILACAQPSPFPRSVLRAV
jgi:hypothetical protein